MHASAAFLHRPECRYVYHNWGGSGGTHVSTSKKRGSGPKLLGWLQKMFVCSEMRSAELWNKARRFNLGNPIFLFPGLICQTLYFGNSCLEGLSAEIDDRSVAVSSKHHCSSHIVPWTARSSHFRSDTPPLASGSLQFKFHTQQSPVYRKEPVSTSVDQDLARETPPTITAKMPQRTRWACVLHRWTTRLEQTSASKTRHCRPKAVPKIPKTSFIQ